MRRFQLLDLIERLRAAVSDIVVRGDIAHEETAKPDRLRVSRMSVKTPRDAIREKSWGSTML